MSISYWVLTVLFRFYRRWVFVTNFGITIDSSIAIQWQASGVLHGQSDARSVTPIVAYNPIERAAPWHSVSSSKRQPRADIAEVRRNRRRNDENGNYFGKHAAPPPQYQQPVLVCNRGAQKIANIGDYLCFDDFIERQEASVYMYI